MTLLGPFFAHHRITSDRIIRIAFRGSKEPALLKK
jgi:hypothetical protein